MSNRTTILLAAVFSTAIVGGVAWPGLWAADTKPKYTIKEVMKATHKGDDAVSKRVASGKGTKDDFILLVEYYESLPLCTPTKGDKADWDKKANALLKSAKAMKAGEPDAMAQYKQASNCKACHSLYKPD
jgi:hypothetical protein